MRTLSVGVALYLALALFVSAPAVAAEAVDLNDASAEELAGLHGIGDVLAGRIIDYRKKHDGFDSVAQLEEVKGIGSATLKDLKGKVEVGD